MAKRARLLGDGKSYQMGNSDMYGKQLMEQLHGQMMNQSDYCDVIVTCGETDIKAHWCVLAGAPYFQSLYNSGLEERKHNRVHIMVDSVQALRTVLTFLYTGSVCLDSTTLEVLAVLELANYLQVDDLKKLCEDFMHNYVITNVDNCIQLYAISDMYNLKTKGFILSYIQEQLDFVIKSESALEMKPDLIRSLIEDPVLSYVSREDFFNFLTNWVNEDLEGRTEHFHDLFCSIALEKMSLEFLKKDVQSSTVVTSSKLCVAKCKATIKKFFRGELCSDGKTDVIIVTGTITNEYPRPMRVFGYIVAENRWCALPNIPLMFDLSDVKFAFSPAKNCLFVCTQDNEKHTKYKFDFNKQTWTKRAYKLSPIEEMSESFNLWIGSILIMEKGHKSYIVAKVVLERGKSNVYLLEANQELTRYQKCSLVYESHSIINIKEACVARNKYICIMLVDKYASNTLLQTKVFVKKASSRKLVEITKEVSLKGEGATLFAFHKKLYMTHKMDINKVLHSVYDLLLGKWINLNCEKPLFKRSANENSGWATCEDRLYIFGGQKRRGKNVLQSPTDYSIAVDVTSGNTEDIANLPTALTNCSALHVRVPQQYVRCHINCPHCNALANGTRENISYSESESEDEIDS
ncbi:uncharacterized protein LOC127871298 isoform X4 [Dreissena polymorpha]|nr:uncharacterized protein LOC127871298 isoform X3 [Dreissena polymorpha]XP_052270028.1 uncharacterized protein LOC127871298 isoform X3 [Dreissena polymorpha]XP_052270030.1 uncharacterized protein LOC127871298 isoform X4 [Dreissena polymorpha]